MRVDHLVSPFAQPRWLYEGVGNRSITPQDWLSNLLPNHIRGVLDQFKDIADPFSTDVFKGVLSDDVDSSTHVSFQACMSPETFPATTQAYGGDKFLGTDFSWTHIALDTAKKAGNAGHLMLNERDTGSMNGKEWPFVDETRTLCQLEVFK